MKRREFIVAGGTAAGAVIAAPAIVRAQSSWPPREITIIVAVSPGSSSDTVARIIAKIITRDMKIPVQVKNVLGGAGLTGFSELAASKADGSVFGVVNVGGLLIFPHIMQVPYTWDSFRFLGAIGKISYGIGTAADSPFKTVEDIIAIGKTRAVTYATSTILNGYCMIQLANLTGAKFRFVATNTSPEAVAAAVGGHVDLVVQSPPDMAPLLDSKQLRLVASAIDRRWPSHPDVKTLIESGYKAENIIPSCFACPSGVPAEAGAKLEQIIAAVAKDPELVDVMQKLFIEPGAMNGKQLYETLKAQAPAVEAALAEAGMKKT